MADTDDRSISQLNTAADVNESTLFEVATVDQGSSTGFSSFKATLAMIGSKIVSALQFTQNLNTTNKTVTGAINEVRGVVITDTLEAGDTQLVISNASITASSTFDVYTDVYGISPTDIVVATGSVTLTFDAQASDISVKVVIK